MEKVKENYILLNVEYSNGLPCVEFKEFFSLDKAEQAYSKLVSKAKEEYKDEYFQQQLENNNYIRSYFADSNNMKGNGILIALTTENNIMNKITDKVDNSGKTMPYHRFDSEMTAYNVPTLEINMQWFEDMQDDYPDDYTAYKVNYIVKRPSFDDVDEFIYDVYMNVQYGNKDDNTAHCESLEEIPIEILITIYKIIAL